MKLPPFVGSPITSILVAGLFGLALAFVASTALKSALQEERPSRTPARASSSAAVTGPVADYRAIVQRNLFGAKTSDPGQASSAAAVTQIDLSGVTLLGTIAGDTPSAVLQVNDTASRFKLNQQVPDIGRITRIERNRVTLRLRSGEQVALVPPEEARTASAPQPAKASVSGSSPTSGYGITALNANRWLIPRSAADQVRKNFSTILQQARLVPMVVKGETVGFSIVRPGPLLQQLGLRRGDILQQVNGILLDSPGKAMQIFTQLEEARNVSLGLKRGTQQLSFEYEVR